MKILVIGGRGFLGKFMAAAIEKRPDTSVYIGTSRPPASEKYIHTNLNDPDNYEILKGFDFIVNCFDLIPHSYDSLIPFCLKNNIKFIETTATPTIISKCISIKNTLESAVGNGLFIFGAGVFPGISNMLCSYHIKKNAALPKKLESVIRYKIISGAGKGMCELMVETISKPCFWVEDYKITESKRPIPDSKQFPLGKKHFNALQIGLPEVLILKDLYNIPIIKTYIGFRPVILAKITAPPSNIIPFLGFFKKPALNFMFYAFYFIRTKLLKNKRTDIDIFSVIDDTSAIRVWFNDALLVAGYFVSAVIDLLSETQPNAISGVKITDEIWDYEKLVSRILHLSQNEIKYRIFEG